MSQFTLFVNGPVCSGKTSTIDEIMSKYKKVFRLSQNKIKWLISDYTPDRDRAVVQKSLLLVAEEMLKNGMSLILEGGSVTQGSMNQALEEISKKYGVKTVYVNIEAPMDVLKARFADRVKDSIERGTRLSFTDDAGYMQRYDAYMAIKGNDPVLDSGTYSAEEIAKQIMTIIGE